MERWLIRVTCLLWLTATPAARASSPLSSRIEGVYAQLDGGGSALGADVFAEAGLTSSGLRTLWDGDGLMLWDARLAARGGALAKSLPLNPFLGGAGSGEVEVGRRLGAAADWRGYVGVGLGAAVDALSSTQVPFSRLYTLGSVDDVGGLFASEAVRVAGGASLVRRHHSVLVTGFLQSQLRLPSLTSAVALYDGGGVHVRWDIERKLIASLDYFAGVSPRVGNGALAYTQQTVREQLTARFRLLLDARSWIGAEASFSQELTTTRFAGIAPYHATAAPSVSLAVQYGYSLGGPG